DGLLGRVAVVSEDLFAAVDYQLRRVYLGREHARVPLLPRRKERLREGVAPAEPVPVVDVLAEDDDPRAVDGLEAVEGLEGLVGGGTARAALGRKELGDHRDALGAGQAGCQNQYGKSHIMDSLWGARKLRLAVVPLERCRTSGFWRLPFFQSRTPRPSPPI